MKKHIPNFITSLNLTAGFLSIIFSINEEPVIASWLIILAMVFDFFDGFFARLLDSRSDIGKELDSLADLVSFGVAPAIIVYMYLATAMDTGIGFTGLSNIKILLLMTPVILPVCAALRLAKFNTDETQKDSFKGLATPAAALAIITVVLAREYSGSLLAGLLLGSVFINIIFTLTVSVLMVIRLPMLSLKFHNLKFSGNEGRFILIFLVIAGIIIFGIKGAPFIVPIYIVISLISNHLARN